MNRKTVFIIFCFAAGFVSGVFAQDSPAQTPAISNLEPFKKGERVLIMAPHPDDEAIGCAGVIQQALSAGAKVKVVYLTNGEHNQLAFIVYEKRLVFRKGEFIHMGEVRRKEAVAAMKVLGLDSGNLIFLGYPDFGTFNMLCRYWQSKKPFKDMMTRISRVPYKENLSYGAPYVAENMLSDLEKVLLDYKPTKIFVSHPADVNRDHETFYLLLEIALSDLNGQMPQPQVYPYLIHRVGWPLPRHYHPELALSPPKQFSQSQVSWRSFYLTEDQLNKKHKATLAYKSQTSSSAFYLLSFARKNELFGEYPAIELTHQVSLGEQGIQFFGFSEMYSDAQNSSLGDVELQIEDKGNASFAVVDQSLLIRVEKGKELNRHFSTQLYIFCYSHNTPFASMPKIRIITKYDRLKIFDGMKMIKAQGADITLKPHAMILRIPLEALGNPDFILASIRSYREDLPVDTTGYRKVIIK